MVLTARCSTAGNAIVAPPFLLFLLAERLQLAFLLFLLFLPSRLPCRPSAAPERRQNGENDEKGEKVDKERKEGGEGRGARRRHCCILQCLFSAAACEAHPPNDVPPLVREMCARTTLPDSLPSTSYAVLAHGSYFQLLLVCALEEYSIAVMASAFTCAKPSTSEPSPHKKGEGEKKRRRK